MIVPTPCLYPEFYCPCTSLSPLPAPLPPTHPPQDLSDTWYGLLTSSAATLLRPPPQPASPSSPSSPSSSSPFSPSSSPSSPSPSSPSPSSPAPSEPWSWWATKGAARAAAIARRSREAGALMVVGGAAYGTAVSELLLERFVARTAGAKMHEQRCPTDNKARRAAAMEVRSAREALLGQGARLAQMEWGVGLRRPKGPAGAASGGVGLGLGLGLGEEVGQHLGAYRDGTEVYGTTPEAALGPLLVRCVDGVLGAVVVEGGMRHARAVARRLVEVAEACDEVGVQREGEGEGERQGV